MQAWSITMRTEVSKTSPFLNGKNSSRSVYREACPDVGLHERWQGPEWSHLTLEATSSFFDFGAFDRTTGLVVGTMVSTLPGIHGSYLENSWKSFMKLAFLFSCLFIVVIIFFATKEVFWRFSWRGMGSGGRGEREGERACIPEPI